MFLVDRIDWLFHVRFPAPNLPENEKPAWVKSYLVGVASAVFTANHKRGDSSK